MSPLTKEDWESTPAIMFGYVGIQILIMILMAAFIAYFRNEIISLMSLVGFSMLMIVLVVLSFEDNERRYYKYSTRFVGALANHYIWGKKRC